MNNTILHINSSAREKDSLTRKVSQNIVNQIHDQYTDHNIIVRNVASGVSFVDEQWVAANFTPADQRTESQLTKLAISDGLVKELQNASHIVIGAPIYNFSIPATLKAWVDMVARAGVTFKYTPTGPVGLLKDKQVYIAMASGGVELGSAYDFASDYLKHVMAFIGLNDVKLINANSYDFSQQL